MAKTTTRFGAAVAAGAAVAMAVGASALPAAADTSPLLGCVTDCVTTFDTIGTGFEFEVPGSITELTVSIGGGAGAPQALALEIFPDAVGGPGGAATIDLGTEYAGQTLYFGVGGVGGASSIQEPEGDLLIVAGGGGGGGFGGRLDLPGQIFATYPGGAGASPTVAGLINGEDATAYGSNAANGIGGNDAFGGDGGTGDPMNGDVDGDDGSSIGTVTDTSFTAAAGGAGGSLVENEVEYEAGRGGDGITGGGGGAIVHLEVDENPFDLVAPGGGGSGLLGSGLTGVADEPNTGTGYVSFTYSLKAAPALPSTGSEVSSWIVWAALGMLVIGGVSIVAASRRRSA